MGRPSTARIARARAFRSWFGGFCTHLDGEELILLLEEHHEGRPRPEPCPFESSLVDVAPKRHENVIEPSIETSFPLSMLNSKIDTLIIISQSSNNSGHSVLARRPLFRAAAAQLVWRKFEDEKPEPNNTSTH